jgi:cytochrome c-type biogenesis protein
MSNVSFGAALLAGVASFLSPCVLPLVPPYLVFITGVSLEDMTAEGAQALADKRRRVLLASLMFVLGFTTVFVALGASASYAGQVLRAWAPLLAKIAGLFIIVMGLHFLGLFKIGLLNREARYQQKSNPAGLVGAYGVGLAFAFGWTPCIGPVLAAILTIAASEQNVVKGAALLAVYSLGLGIPFLIAGASVGGFLRFFARFRRHMLTVERVMGALLVLTGLMFLTGAMQAVSFWLLEHFPSLSAVG